MVIAAENATISSVTAETVGYVALGANLGDRAGNLREAARRLADTPGVRVTKTSTFLDNPAVGGPDDSPPFLNAVAEVRTSLNAFELLAALLQIEREMGRIREMKWGPRLIDLDLVLFGDEVIDSPVLKVPHPLMQEREFVLQPLAEIAPAAIHPLFGCSARDLTNDLRLRSNVSPRSGVGFASSTIRSATNDDRDE